MISAISAATTHVEKLVWFKASASNNSTGCVEVAWLPDGQVGVRDSKDRTKPPLILTATAWAYLLHTAKAGDLDPR